MIPNIQPMKWAQEFAIVLMVCILIAVLYRYKRRIIFFLTGDERIHADVLDCLNFAFCTCCGLTTGEWTRKLTTHCPCEALRGRNLCKMFKLWCGMAPKTIEVKNIVVGDLPYDEHRGDFYVCITVGANPDMVTALQEQQKPKVVHFPEILQLKVRDSPIEARVHITVKELNVAGSDTLCELKLTPSSIVDWSDDDDPLKRFQMKPINNDIERETAPWIAMEFSKPTEPRLLDVIIDRMADLKVKLFLSTAGGSSAGRTDVKIADGSTLGTRETHEYGHIADFKHAYTLVDDSGNPIEEPDEQDLARLRRYRNCVLYGVHSFDAVIFLAILVYLCARVYVWSCYRQFGWLTQAQLNGWPLLPTLAFPNGKPISNSQLHTVVAECTAKTKGTGAITGMNPCRPDYNQTLTVCTYLPHENRPEAFVGLVHEWTGWDVKGITCAHGVCSFRNQMAEYDGIAMILVPILFLLTRLAKYCGNNFVKRHKKQVQKTHGEKLKNFRDQTLGRTNQPQVSSASAPIKQYGSYSYKH